MAQLEDRNRESLNARTISHMPYAAADKRTKKARRQKHMQKIAGDINGDMTAFFNIDTKDLPAKPADPSKKITLANAATPPPQGWGYRDGCFNQPVPPRGCQP